MGQFSGIRFNKKSVRGLFVVLLLFISLGYALLTAELKINGNSKISAQSWDIHWNNVQVSQGSVSIGSGNQAATITAGDTTEVTYAVTLSQPGDFYEFTVDAVNAGSIDAMIDVITSTYKIGNGEVTTITSSNLPSYLEYSVEYTDGSDIARYNLLAAGTTETYKVKIGYKSDIQVSDLPDADQTIQLDFSVNYVQANDNAQERLAGSMLEMGRVVNAKMKLLAMEDDGLDYLTAEEYNTLATKMQTQVASGEVASGEVPIDTNANLSFEEYKAVDAVTTDDYNIYKVLKANALPNGFTPTITNTISTSNSTNPIYMWYDLSEHTIYVYSESNTIYLNPDSSYLFYYMRSLNDVSFLTNLNSSKLTNMRSMFSETLSLNNLTPLTNINTSKVTNMKYLFSVTEPTGTKDFSSITNWNTSNVKLMCYSFSGNVRNTNATFLANWDVSKVEDMAGLFKYYGGYASTLNIDLSNWVTSNLVYMPSMFEFSGVSADSFTIDISSFNTSKVTDLIYAFFIETYGTGPYRIIIPATNSAGINNTSNTIYGKDYPWFAESYFFVLSS